MAFDKEEFKRRQQRYEKEAWRWIGRLYVISFNAYAFYWLYKHICVTSATGEEWLQYWFAVVGMNYFYLDKKEELMFRIKNKA